MSWDIIEALLSLPLRVESVFQTLKIITKTSLYIIVKHKCVLKKKNLF